MASIYRLKNSKNWYYCITYNGKKYQGSTKTTDKQSAKQIAESIQTDLARETYDLPALRNKSIVNFTILWQEYIKNQQTQKIHWQALYQEPSIFCLYFKINQLKILIRST
jgi:hypothetical protein